MPAESIVIVCPDTNIELSPGRLAERATGGGKAALLRLAQAWVELGHPVTVASGTVASGAPDGGHRSWRRLWGARRGIPRAASGAAREGQRNGVTVQALGSVTGSFDVAIYVTGSKGHFRDHDLSQVVAERTLFWINGPNWVEPPSVRLDWFVAPAAFLADRAIREWGFPIQRVALIRGEGVPPRLSSHTLPPRDSRAVGYFSHPDKGLAAAVTVLTNLCQEFPGIRLDVFGSERLWGDNCDVKPRGLPEWVRAKGEVPQDSLFDLMPRYGLMLYLSSWVDGFSVSTAEALAGGVVVVAAGHGANAELIQHGRNGFLIPVRDGAPDLKLAEDLVRTYLRDPESFDGMRQHAAASVVTWDEQALLWRELWRSPVRPGRAGDSRT